MINLYFKQLWLTILFLIICSMETYSALTICSTAVWLRNATTIAGVQSGTSGSTVTSLDGPEDAYIDINNVIYVLDAGNYRIQRIISNSTVGTTCLNSTNGTELNQFAFMDAMSIDINNDIYILDGGNARVTKWIQGSSSATLMAGGNGIGNNSNQMNAATGMFIDFDTSIIWIADTGNHRIVKWTSPTTSAVVCGGYGSNNDQFMYPAGLFIDTSNSNILYVADTNNHRIQMWLPEAVNGTTVAGITSNYGMGLNQLWFPKTLIVDNNQNMFIVDRYNNRILKWIIGENSGMIIAGDTTSGTQSNQLNNPMNINFDSSGSLFVVDTFNNRIQKFLVSCPAAQVDISDTTISSIKTIIPVLNINCPIVAWLPNATTIAGTSLGWVDSAVPLLSNPRDIFVDPNNTLYVVDTGNLRVQVFVPNSTNGTTLISSTSGSLLNQFSFLTAISGDLNGNIYILDRGNSRAIKLTPGGVNSTIVAGGNMSGNSSNQLNYPSGLFIDLTTSFIWIADTGNSRIVRWESPSTGIVVCGSNGTGSNQFFKPFGLFVNTTASNTLFVADTYNHRVQMWLPGATDGTTVAGQTGVFDSETDLLYYPIAVIGDTDGNLYILNYGSACIMRWTIGSTFGVVVVGNMESGTAANELYEPYNYKFDSSGDIIVADTINNRVQKFFVTCMNMTSTTTTTKILTTSRTTNVLSKASYSPTTSILTIMSTTTGKMSMACVDNCPQWLLMIFCSIIILMNN